MFSFFHRWFSGHKQVRQHKRRLAPRVNRRSHAVERLEDRSMLAISSLLLHTGVDGEAPDGPPGHIEIESFSFGTAKSGATGHNTGAGSATILDFIKAPTNHEPSGYLTYKLENVFVTSYQIGGISSGGDLPTESVSFNFAAIHIPRIGQEVIVDFLEGDPDQPIVIGSYQPLFTVNIVDFIDEDNISTPFNFCVVNGGLGTDQINVPLTHDFVFGTELPPVVLNEILCQGNGSQMAPGTGISPGELERISLGFDPFEILRDFNAAAFDTANATGPLFCVQYRETAFNFVSSVSVRLASSQEYFTILISPLEHYDYPGYALQPANQPPVVAAGDDATLVEGQTFSRAATFTDDYSDAGPWTATVDYGDGSGEQPLVLNADKSFALSHTYTDDGTYTVTVRVTDEHGAVGTDTLTVTAQNALPHFSAVTLAPVHERQLATLQAAVDDSNPFDPLTVTIDWGDGSAPQVLALPPGTRTIHPTHRYAHDGQFTVKLSVSDDDGSLATAQVQANVQNVDIIAVGVDSGSAPLVQVFDSNTHALKFNITPYESNFRGGVRVATADLNGDGVSDIVTVPGAGRQAQIKVFDGASGQLLAGPVGSILGFEKTFLGGVYVAAGDVNGDGLADIIVGRGSGKPEVRVFSGANGSQLSSFFAYAPNFGGGVYVAAGDVNGDGFADIITGPAAGNSAPQVKVFNGLTDSLIASFLAYSPSFHGGVFVAAGDVDGDGRAEIVTGPGAGGAPQVKVFSAATLKAIDSFFAYDPSFHGGVRVAVGDVNGDGRADIITGAGNGATQKVRAFDGLSLAVLDSFFALDPKAGNGLFVAASR